MGRRCDIELRSGLTLVETVVVVAIIVILVGLIVPMISRVGQRAQVLECANNLKQLGTSALFEFEVNGIPDQVIISGTGIDTGRDDTMAPQSSSAVVLVHVVLPPPDVPKSPPPPVPLNIATEAELRCPLAERNPRYGFYPDEPPTHSYGIYKGSLGKRVEEAWIWLFAESVFDKITEQSDISYRHNNASNVFFKDGRVELIHPRLVPFQDLDPED